VARRGPRLAPWQSRCLAQLKASAAQLPDTLRLTGQPTLDEETGLLLVSFTLDTQEIPRRPRGLPLQDVEPFVVAIGAHDDRPPTVFVEHHRFLGHPHVLSGYQLCLYLDETREWDPEQGMNGQPNGVLNRLWRWLHKGAMREFNANDALYHAVGGLPQLSRTGMPLPPIVVRDLPPQQGRVGSAWLVARSDWCLDLRVTKPHTEDAEHIPVFFADHDLPFGAGRNYLYELTARLERHYIPPRARVRLATLTNTTLSAVTPCGAPDCPATAVPRLEITPSLVDTSPGVALLTALAASASRKPWGSPQTLFLAVPHPVGGPRHLIAVYFEPALGDQLRRITANRTSPLITFDKAQLDCATPLRWCNVSDERQEVTKRRDTGRPVAAYRDKTVVVWGVGGLGSWVGEYVVRAGAKAVKLCDTGIVTGGLLVRQNYLDEDIGTFKAERLAARLRSISPGTAVEPLHKISDDDLDALVTEADLIIDATVNRSVTRRLDTLTARPSRTCVVAQVATDARTGTLGLAMVDGPSSPTTLLQLDAHTGRSVEGNPALEAYQVFWRDPEPGDEFVPTRGCSLPTFHGSAADLAAVAACLCSLIAPHLVDGATGSHLFALPHAGVTPSYQYIHALAEEQGGSGPPRRKTLRQRHTPF
jgi:hypothetical protein